MSYSLQEIAAATAHRLGLTGELLVRLQTNILRILHGTIQVCDGTANFWDGAVHWGLLWHLRLNTVADSTLKVRTVVAAERELFPVFHDDAVLAVEPWLHLFDPINLHDG